MENQQAAQFTPGWNDPPQNVSFTAGGVGRIQRKRLVDPSIQGSNSSPVTNNYSQYQQSTPQYNQQSNFSQQNQQSTPQFNQSPNFSQQNQQSTPQFNQPPNLIQQSTPQFNQPSNLVQQSTPQFNQPPNLVQQSTPQFNQPSNLIQQSNSFPFPNQGNSLSQQQAQFGQSIQGPGYQQFPQNPNSAFSPVPQNNQQM